jgi:hypothetical protein
VRRGPGCEISGDFDFVKSAVPNGGCRVNLAAPSPLRVNGIGFRSLTEALDTTTAQGRLVFHMFGSPGYKFRVTKPSVV